MNAKVRESYVQLFPCEIIKKIAKYIYKYSNIKCPKSKWKVKTNIFINIENTL